MDWKDVAGTVAKFAPMLGTALLGPGGTAIGAIIASEFGGSTPDDVSAALATNPDAAVKLRQIEADNRAELQRLAVQAEANRLAASTQELQIAAEDRKDARKLGAASKIPGALAMGITAGFFSILAIMMMGIWKPADNQALLILLGALGTSWGAVVNYYFGSSAGSARKDEIMASKG